MIDECSSNLLHSTYAWVLFEMDISKGLPTEIEIKTSNGCWTQPLDYEVMPFRCRRCHQVGHLASKCSKERTQRKASWWKDTEEQHYTVMKNAEVGENQKSFSQVVTDSPQMLPTSAKEETKHQAAPTTKKGPKAMISLLPETEIGESYQMIL